MPYLPADYATRLRRAGLDVTEISGWRTRGRPGPFVPVGSLQHHTGANAVGWSKAEEMSYARWLFLTGRSDLPAPLCHRSTARDGTVYLGAAGRANHAGKAKASGSVAAGDGNSLYTGDEWMVSGKQAIPKALYDSAVTSAAVDLHMFGNSARATSGHFQTSVTGKWDPGENGKSIDMNKFRRDVEARMAALYAKPTPPKPSGPTAPFTVAQWSTQFSDSPAKKRHDADAVFSLGYDAIGITEASKSDAGKKTREIVRKAAAKYGYTVRFGKGDTGVAVKLSTVSGSVKEGYEKVVNKRTGDKPHGERGIQWVRYVHKVHGPVRVAAVHYVTKHTPGSAATNRRYADAIGAWAQKMGRGERIAFVLGDMNMDDQHTDVFFGQPIATCWDDRKKWPNTAPKAGTIDVIARYTKDSRVGKCAAVKVWKDDELPLHGDHFLVVARYDIVKG
jgi:hypothetical protein